MPRFYLMDNVTLFSLLLLTFLFLTFESTFAPNSEEIERLQVLQRKITTSQNGSLDLRGVVATNQTQNPGTSESLLLLQRIHGLNEEHFMHQLNEEQRIQNLDLYGPVTNATHVIVVQVHTRLKYLATFLNLLSQVRGIEDGLLILSHDVYYPLFNEEIKRLKFTRVLQIFYPYAMESNFYHGPDVPKRKGALMKLHWWWKANFVFNRIRALENFTGIVSFTEEDVYITRNALWMLTLMRKAMEKGKCSGCQAVTIAEHHHITGKLWDKPAPNDTDFARTYHSNLFPSLHLAFNRTLWQKFRRCADEFCRYNDYNWDWTLRHMVDYKKCLKEKISFFALAHPRILHIGTCGRHHQRQKGKTCNQTDDINRVNHRTKWFSERFPKKLGKIWDRSASKAFIKGFGGFEEAKNVQLCMSFTKSNLKNETYANYNATMLSATYFNSNSTLFNANLNYQSVVLQNDA